MQPSFNYGVYENKSMRNQLMKNRVVRRLSVVILACCGLLPALGDDVPGPPPPPSRVDRLAQLLMIRDIILKKYDTNGDGVIDAGEKKILLKDAEENRQEARRKFIEKFDLDKDGKLSVEEKKKLHDQFKQQRQAAEVHFRQEDRNEAGTAGKKTHPRPVGENGRDVLPPPPIPRIVVENSHKKKFLVRPSLFLLAQSLILKKYDSDGDGVLSRDEVDVVIRDSRKLYADKAKAMLALYDKDGDGLLSDEERKAALESIRRIREKQEDDSADMDDIDLFIQETYDTELMESLEEGYTLLQTEEEGNE